MDVLCTDDLDAFGRDLDDPVAELRHDVLHMLLESYGSNIEVPERGIGLEDALSSPIDARTLKHRIETQLQDDPRVDAARADITMTDSQTYVVNIFIQANGTELGVSITFDAAGNYLSSVKTS